MCRLLPFDAPWYELNKTLGLAPVGVVSFELSADDEPKPDNVCANLCNLIFTSIFHMSL